MTAEATPARRPSIAEIRAIDRKRNSSGRELIVPEEARERNLQEVFVEVLAHSGIPFETAFQIADVAWDIHRNQLEKRSEPDEPVTPRKHTKKQLELIAKLEAMTPEEREERSRRIWDELLSQPGFKENIDAGIENMEMGRYYSMEAIRLTDGLPKLQVVDSPSPQSE